MLLGLAFPFFLMFVGIYLIFKVSRAGMFQNDQKLAKLFYSFTKYMLSFILLNLPYFLTLLISIFITVSVEKLKWLRWTVQLTSLLSCSIPLILSIQRSIQRLVRIGWIEKARKMIRVKIYGMDTEEDDDADTTAKLGTKDEYEWIERHVLKNFMRDIFIGISYCIDFDSKNIKDYDINLKHPGVKQLDMQLRNIKLQTDYKLDNTIGKNEEDNNYEVQIIEYAPEIFQLVRNKEGIDFKKMVKSFLPKNNAEGIKEGQGKSGAFFISTDDNQFIIKTLKTEELELIRYTYLEMLTDFIKKGNMEQSIIVPIYGIFNLLTVSGGNSTFFVMRNLFGDFKENITCKYDLKGSTLGRKQDLDKETVEKTVMKDLNFEEIERALLISKEDGDRLVETCENDSKFLAKMGLMDYSLLVCKLSLNKAQTELIFGDGRLPERKTEDSKMQLLPGKMLSSKDKKKTSKKPPIKSKVTKPKPRGTKVVSKSKAYETGSKSPAKQPPRNPAGGVPHMEMRDLLRNALKENALKRNPELYEKEQMKPKEKVYEKEQQKELTESLIPQNLEEEWDKDTFEIEKMDTVERTNLLNEEEQERLERQAENLQYYKKYLYKSLQEGQAYIIAIIDYLTIYNFFKVVETNYKFVVQCKGSNVESLSCVDPATYSERFIKFIKKISDSDRILHPENYEEEEVDNNNKIISEQ